MATTTPRAQGVHFGEFRLALVGGVLLGLAAALSNNSVFTSSLGQMVTPWVLLAVFVGERSRRGLAHAAVAGAVALIVANGAYFLVGVVAFGTLSARYWAIWTAVGAVVGPIAAVTGRYVRCGTRSIRILAAAALAAVPIAEGVVLWGHIRHTDAHITYLFVGFVAATIPTFLLFREGTAAVVVSTAVALVLVAPIAVAFEFMFTALGIV